MILWYNSASQTPTVKKQKRQKLNSIASVAGVTNVNMGPVLCRKGDLAEWWNKIKLFKWDEVFYSRCHEALKVFGIFEENTSRSCFIVRVVCTVVNEFVWNCVRVVLCWEFFCWHLESCFVYCFIIITTVIWESCLQLSSVLHLLSASLCTARRWGTKRYAFFHVKHHNLVLNFRNDRIVSVRIFTIYQLT